MGEGRGGVLEQDNRRGRPHAIVQMTTPVRYAPRHEDRELEDGSGPFSELGADLPTGASSTCAMGDAFVCCARPRTSLFPRRLFPPLIACFATAKTLVQSVRMPEGRSWMARERHHRVALASACSRPCRTCRVYRTFVASALTEATCAGRSAFRGCNGWAKINVRAAAFVRRESFRSIPGWPVRPQSSTLTAVGMPTRSAMPSPSQNASCMTE